MSPENVEIQPPSYRVIDREASESFPIVRYNTRPPWVERLKPRSRCPE
jgi:hypothetical protein